MESLLVSVNTARLEGDFEKFIKEMVSRPGPCRVGSPGKTGGFSSVSLSLPAAQSILSLVRGVDGLTRFEQLK